MFLLQKNVPNFKVIKMFVFAYCTTALITIYRAPNIQRNWKICARNLKYSPKVWGTTN